MSSVQQLDRPDCPLEHKCERCDHPADTVVCMYHLPTKQVKYRYLCFKCDLEVKLFQVGMGFTPVNLREVEYE